MRKHKKALNPEVSIAHCFALDLFVQESRTLIMKGRNRNIQGLVAKDCRFGSFATENTGY